VFRKSIIAPAVAAVCPSASAAISADEAHQPGSTPTAAGARNGANEDGTVAANAVGLTEPPSGDSGTIRAEPAEC